MCRFDRSRRLLLGVADTTPLAALLRPLCALTHSDKLRIGVIGSGHIGSTIGRSWIKSRHLVLFSSRHPEELKELVAELGPLAHNGTVAQAISFGVGKITLDACNAVPARDGTIAEEVERNGIGVTSQKYLPGTRLVRAFNMLSHMILAREANRPDPTLAIPLQAMMPRRCKLPLDSCATPASRRWWSASLPRRVDSSVGRLVTASR
jgi:hypothetical protein